MDHFNYKLALYAVTYTPPLYRVMATFYIFYNSYGMYLVHICYPNVRTTCTCVTFCFTLTGCIIVLVLVPGNNT